MIFFAKKAAEIEHGFSGLYRLCGFFYLKSVSSAQSVKSVFYYVLQKISENLKFELKLRLNLKLMKLGITGGIGSGKSTVCKIFEVLGIPVYYADDRAKWLMNNDTKLIKGVKSTFGDEAYHPDGTLNRPFIADIVFNDKSKLAELNALVHPAVFQDGVAWNEANANAPYTLKEAAILFESGSYLTVDKVITVFTPKEIRIQRVLTRDDTTREAIEARMDKQMPEEEKIERSDFVIYNDDEHSLIEQVLNIHKELLNE